MLPWRDAEFCTLSVHVRYLTVPISTNCLLQVLDKGAAAIHGEGQGHCSMGRRCRRWSPVPCTALGLACWKSGNEEGGGEALKRTTLLCRTPGERDPERTRVFWQWLVDLRVWSPLRGGLKRSRFPHACARAHGAMPRPRAMRVGAYFFIV